MKSFRKEGVLIFYLKWGERGVLSTFSFLPPQTHFIGFRFFSKKPKTYHLILPPKSKLTKFQGVRTDIVMGNFSLMSIGVLALRLCKCAHPVSLSP